MPTSRSLLFRVVHYARSQALGLHPKLSAAQWLVGFVPLGVMGNVRALLYRRAGFKGIGDKVYIHGPMDLRGVGALGPRLHIGDCTTINWPIYINLNAPVHIGSRVSIGHHCIIITSNHALGPPEERRGRIVAKPVSIGDGAWLGARVMLLPGVRVGAGAFVMAGAVVTRDVPPNARVGGNPAALRGWLGRDAQHSDADESGVHEAAP